MTGNCFQQNDERTALIVGGDSLIGSALAMHCRCLGISIEITSRRRRENTVLFDLGDPDFAPFEQAAYTFAFVCAAVTDMRACQRAPVTTRRINVESTVELIRRLTRNGTHVVFLSSSQVFDGETPLPEENAPTCPKNEYGAQKLAVEQAIVGEDLAAAVLRVTKVLADQPAGIFKGWLEALDAGETIQAATNMALSPIVVSDVALAAARLAAGHCRGVWHLSACDEVGYFEAARRMAQARGLPDSVVQGRPVTEGEVPGIYRQRHAALSSEKIARSLRVPLRHAGDVLDRLFAGSSRPATAP